MTPVPDGHLQVVNRGRAVEAVRHYTAAEVAERLGISARLAREWIADGRLRSVDLAEPGARPNRRVRADHLQAFSDDLDRKQNGDLRAS